MKAQFNTLNDLQNLPLTVERKETYFFYAAVTAWGKLTFGYRNLEKDKLVAVVVDGTESEQTPQWDGDYTIISAKTPYNGFNRLYEWLNREGYVK